MFKILVICVLWITVCSESIESFTGRWLPIVMYSNTFTKKTETWVGWHSPGYIGLWTGWLLEPKECGYVEVKNTSQYCTCDDRNDIPLVRIEDFANLKEHQFYQFRMNESRPVIVVNRVDDVKKALSAKCKCGDKEMTQLVFRRTTGNQLMTYENEGKTKTSPNMTLVMFRYVPTMVDLQSTTRFYPSMYLDTPYQEPTLMCDPSFFDDSAYVVDSSENDSPFITLGDLKNGNLETPSTTTEDDSSALALEDLKNGGSESPSMTTGDDSSTLAPDDLKNGGSESPSMITTGKNVNNIELLSLTAEYNDTKSSSVWTENDRRTVKLVRSSSDHIQPLLCIWLLQLVAFYILN